MRCRARYRGNPVLRRVVAQGHPARIGDEAATLVTMCTDDHAEADAALAAWPPQVDHVLIAGERRAGATS